MLCRITIYLVENFVIRLYSSCCCKISDLLCPFRPEQFFSLAHSVFFNAFCLFTSHSHLFHLSSVYLLACTINSRCKHFHLFPGKNSGRKEIKPMHGIVLRHFWFRQRVTLLSVCVGFIRICPTIHCPYQFRLFLCIYLPFNLIQPHAAPSKFRWTFISLQLDFILLLLQLRNTSEWPKGNCGFLVWFHFRIGT